MRLTPENTSRRIDAMGRIVLPKGLRQRFGVRDNDELEFLSLELDGKHYICLTNSKTVDPKYRTAALVLEELGEQVPESLLKKINLE